MPTQQLTDVVVRSAKLPEKGQYVIWDRALPGFGLRVSQGGSRSFVVMFYQGARRRRVTIGKFPVIGVATARQEAKRILASVTLGEAPEMPSRREEPAKLAAAIDLFLETHCARNNRPKTAIETERLLKRHFVPKLGLVELSEIKPAQIAGIIDGLLDRPGEANHAFAAIRKFFSWARDRRMIDRSPCEGMRLPVRPRARDRVLSEHEVMRVFDAAETFGYPYGNIVRLLLLTGQRRQEIVGLRWDEIDWKAATLTIPAERNKSGRLHTVPLAPMALEVLEALPRLHDNVFPARGRPERTFSGFSKSKRQFDEACGVNEWTLHDLRRTVATNLAGLGTPPHIVERILNHTSGTISGVAAIYNRFGYLDEMRKALEQWEGKLRTLAARVAVA